MAPTSATDTTFSSSHVISRRDLLRGSATLAAALLPTHSSLALNIEDEEFIDAHVHVWTPDTQRYPLAAAYTKADMQPPSFTPQQLMAHARPVGVARVVLIQMSFYGNDNSYMLQTMHDHPGVYSGVAVVDENDRVVAKMKQLASEGVRGFRIRPSDQNHDTWLQGEGMQAMWRCGADEQLAMCHLINPGDLPAVDRMCARYPRTPVVIDHFARIGVDGEVRREDLDRLCRLARFEQVSVKVSAFYALGQKKPPYRDLGPMIRSLRDAYGAERLMWASDCPYQVQGIHAYQPSIDLIKTGLDFLSADERLSILRKTAERVFFADRK
jgi:predicted TIM-barrel fold metal-dependent hydrolase